MTEEIARVGEHGEVYVRLPGVRGEVMLTWRVVHEYAQELARAVDRAAKLEAAILQRGGVPYSMHREEIDGRQWEAFMRRVCGSDTAGVNTLPLRGPDCDTIVPEICTQTRSRRTQWTSKPHLTVGN